jgi:hypothetical protein
VKTAALVKTAAGERMAAAKAAARAKTAGAERMAAAKAATAKATTAKATTAKAAATAMAATAATPTPREHGGGSSEGNDQSDSYKRRSDRLPN